MTLLIALLGFVVLVVCFILDVRTATGTPRLRFLVPGLTGWVVFLVCGYQYIVEVFGL